MLTVDHSQTLIRTRCSAFSPTSIRTPRLLRGETFIAKSICSRFCAVGAATRNSHCSHSILPPIHGIHLPCPRIPRLSRASQIGEWPGQQATSAIYAVFLGDYSLETLPPPPWDQRAYALWAPNQHGFHKLIPQVTATSCARIHINLWLMHGKPPAQEQSVTVTRVQYQHFKHQAVALKFVCITLDRRRGRDRGLALRAVGRHGVAALELPSLNVSNKRLRRL